MNPKEIFEKWLAKTDLEVDLKDELLKIKDNEEEIKSRFGSYLEFGTAGLRGLMGAGTNRMNVYTIRHATQGFADFISSKGDVAKNKGVVIAYDSRNNSSLFAYESAKVLAANGIKVYIFNSLRPTPLLSFAVRYLQCTAGINITASHNPKEYNGYKAYGSDGAQLSPEHASAVMNYISKNDLFDDVKYIDFNDGLKTEIISIISDEVDSAYKKAVIEQSVNPELTRQKGSEIKIIYTPFHGAGYNLVPDILKTAGFTNLETVKEQMTLDGNFPTVITPNPSDTRGFDLAIKQALSSGGDLIIGTDPDADRIVALAKNKEGEFKPFTGNQMGCLLISYLIDAKKSKGQLVGKYAVVKSIVSTYLADEICKANGIDVINVLTGFKYIGEQINKFYETGSHNFLLGFEESCGYLTGNYARDKDAVLGSLLISEMALYYREKGLSLWDVMESIYEKYGCFSDETVDITITGLDASEKIKEIVADIRQNTPNEINGTKVIEITDLKTGLIKSLNDGSTSKSLLPSANVLIFKLEDNSTIVIRPSGTEPKIKLYFYVISENLEKAYEKIQNYKKSLKAKMNL